MTPANYRTRLHQTSQEGITIFYLPDIVFADPNPPPKKSCASISKMKYLALLALFFAGCETVTTTDGKTTTTTRKIDQSEVNALAGTLATVALNVTANRLGVPTTSPAAASVASAALNGIGAQAQAAVGSSPQAANVAQGAGVPNAAIGQQVQAKLPATIDQKTVDAIFASALLAK